MPDSESLGDQDLDLLPDEFTTRIPEKPLGFLAHQADGTSAVEHDHPRREALNEGLEPLRLTLSLGDVGDHTDDENPFLGLERTEAELDRKLGAVLAKSPELASGAGTIEGFMRKRSRWARCPWRNRSGMSISTICPASSSRWNPNNFSASLFNCTIRPARSVMTIAMGDDSTMASNLCSRCFRSVMSRAVAKMIPSSGTDLGVHSNHL